MITCEQVARWHVGAAEQFGDPSVPVAQLFAKWKDNPILSLMDDPLVAIGFREGTLLLVLGPLFPPLPIAIEEEPRVDALGLVAFGAARVTNGVWGLSPSLNVAGLIHAFLVLYDVPDPAPWERRIVAPS